MNRRPLVLALGIVAAAAYRWRRRLACYFIRGRHNPVRRFLGMFECVDCGLKGADLSAFGEPDDGHMSARWRA